MLRCVFDAGIFYCSENSLQCYIKGGSNNLLYVAYFVVDPDQLDSHKEASYNFEVLKYKEDSAGANTELASFLKALGTSSELNKYKTSVKTIEQWHEGSLALGAYAAETFPPIMPESTLNKYYSYSRWFVKFMRRHGANSDADIFRVCLRFDESFRSFQTRTCAPHEFTWDPDDYSEFSVFKEKIEEFQTRKIKKLESKVNSLESKLNNIQSAIKALQNSKKGGGGGDSKDKKGGARKEKFKVLVSPNGVKAKMEHYSTNGKACCLFFNSTAGCSDKNCSFSHHCAACGDTKHGIMGHDD
jgi:hypothetical protein